MRLPWSTLWPTIYIFLHFIPQYILPLGYLIHRHMGQKNEQKVRPAWQITQPTRHTTSI